MDWWPIALTAVLGALALGWAATADRRAASRVADQAASPPERHIPTLSADAPSPAYVSEETALTASTGLPVEDVDSIAASVADTEGLPGGWADEAFVTVPAKGWAVVRDPLVLVCTGIGSFRELLPAVTAAKRAGRSLVVVAPAIERDALRTLTVNAVQGHLPGVAVTGVDMEGAARLATACGATVTSRDDLQSGWLPGSSYGGCALWVCDRGTSWVVPTLDSEPST